MSKQNKSDKRGVGRPSFKVAIPSGRFDFRKFSILNGALKEDGTPFEKNDPNQRCVKLTLRNWLKKDNAKGSKSEVIVLKDELGKPDSESGKGRKPFVYLRRAQFENGKKAASNLKKSKGAAITVPVSDIAPVATPEPTPAPEITVTEPAPVTETATAPVMVS